ncbi:unnamed protein product [Durusdinium trenchii]|uniref:Uncharacterized protein n=1 Tax=Durusdinium trenchii TaxID=1381693 RepID=A0ABP0QWD3_9DINO
MCRPAKGLLRRLAYPHAVDGRSGRSHEVLHTVWSLIQSFLGEPPEIQVATFEVDPFTFNHTVKLWDPRDSLCSSRLLVGHSDTVLTVAMKGNIVVTGSYDCKAMAWDASRGLLLKTILNDCSVTAVGVEHSTIIIGGSNGVASVGKLTGDQPVLDFRPETDSPSSDAVRLLGHQATISAVLLHGSVAVTGSRDATCRIWHTSGPSSGRPKRVLTGHRRRLTSLSMHRNLQLLVTGSADGTARLWNAESGDLLHVLTIAEPSSGQCWPWSDQVVSLAMAGDYVALGSFAGVVQVWNRRTAKTLVLSSGEYGPLGSHLGVAMREGLVVACFKVGFAKAWDVKETKLSPFLLTSGFKPHVANPSYALMI